MNYPSKNNNNVIAYKHAQQNLQMPYTKTIMKFINFTGTKSQNNDSNVTL